MINILGSIRSGPRRALTAFADWILAWQSGTAGSFSEFGLPTRSGVVVDGDSALNYSAVWAATRLVADTTARLPMLVYQRNSDKTKRLATEHPLFNVLARAPNPQMTTMTWRSMATPQLINAGNTYSEIIRNGAGQTVRLWPVHVNRVEPFIDRNDGELRFRITGSHAGTRDVASKDMFNVVGAMSHEGIIGKGVITQARESIGMGLATERYGATLFGNDGRTSGVLTTDKTLSEPALERMRKDWKTLHGGGPDQGNRIAILEEGTIFQAIAIPPEDAQFLGTRQHNITEIARWYGLPPHKLADLMRATFSNIEQLALEFVDALMPWFVRWEQEASRQLLTQREQEQGFFIEHLLLALLQSDSAARSKFYTDLSRIGVLSINEIRGLENLNSIGSDGDTRFVMLNMVPLDRLNEVDFSRGGGGQSSQEQQQQSATPPKTLTHEFGEWCMNEAADAQQKREACEGVVADVLRRLLSREGLAAKCQSTKSIDWLEWLDTYYEKHERLAVDALRAAVRMTLVTNGAIDNEEDDRLVYAATLALASSHVAESRRQLSAIYDTTGKDEFVVAVGTCVDAWPGERSEADAKAWVNEQSHLDFEVMT